MTSLEVSTEDLEMLIEAVSELTETTDNEDQCAQLLLRLRAAHPLACRVSSGGSGAAMSELLAITPTCCQAIQATRAIEIATDDTGKDPRWRLTLASAYDRGIDPACASPPPQVCPYCAAPLPAIEPRAGVTAPIASSEEGYYCDTCKERCCCCYCLPPSARWQPQGGDGLDPNGFYARRAAAIRSSIDLED